jgi:hypothetical protein
MKNKKKVQELLDRLEKWGADKGYKEFNDLLKDLKKTISTEEDTGSNPPGQPPGHKPPGGG